MAIKTQQFIPIRYLEYIKNTKLRADSVKIINSTIIEPVYLGENVEIHNSVIGPHVSIGDNSKVTSSIIQNTIIQTNTHIENANLKDSMIGNHVKYHKQATDLSIGDYNVVK